MGEAPNVTGATVEVVVRKVGEKAEETFRKMDKKENGIQPKERQKK